MPILINNYGEESFADWQPISTPAMGAQTAISPPCRALYIATNGTLSLTAVDGNTTDLKGVKAGTIHHCIAVSMGNDGSGATGIIALY